MLHRVTTVSADEGKVFQFGDDDFPAEMKKVIAEDLRLYWELFPITPHSFRWGGASHDMRLKRLTPDEIRSWGRWKRFEMMYEYVRLGELELMRTFLQDQSRLLRRWIKMCQTISMYPVPVRVGIISSFFASLIIRAGPVIPSWRAYSSYNESLRNEAYGIRNLYSVRRRRLSPTGGTVLRGIRGVWERTI